MLDDSILLENENFSFDSYPPSINQIYWYNIYMPFLVRNILSRFFSLWCRVVLDFFYVKNQKVKK